MGKPKPLKNMDTKGVKKPVGDHGQPILRQGSIPGYNKPTGTPGYIKAAVKHAESLTPQSFSHGGRQDTSHTGCGPHTVGAPPYGSAEKARTEGGHGKQSVEGRKTHA